jgi:hypothetical protein
MFGFGVATTFTACHSGEPEQEIYYEAKGADVQNNTEVKNSTTKQIVLAVTPADATVTFVSNTGRTVTPTVDSEGNVTIDLLEGETGGTLTISKSGYGSKSIVVAYGDGEDTKAYAIQLQKAKSDNEVARTGDTTVDGVKTTVAETANGDGTQTVTATTDKTVAVDQWDANTGEVTTTEQKSDVLVVTNDNDNQKANASADENAEASLIIPTGTVVNTSKVTDQTQGYSITVVNSEELENGSEIQDIEDMKVQSETSTPIQAAPLALDCTPDGIQFDTPIEVKVKVPGAEGFELGLRDENGNAENTAKTAADGTLRAKLSHFSVWDIVLNARLIKKVKAQDVTVGEGKLVKGKNTIEYKRWTGFTTSEKKNTITYKFLQSKFSCAAKQVEKTATYTAQNPGTYQVTQVLYNVTFQSTKTVKNVKKTFTAQVYGSPKIHTTQTKVHSGGTN